MTMDKTWYAVDAAAAKFGVPAARILSWVEEGLVRAEEEQGKVVRVNVDDLELKVEELTGL